jgi:HSP20 family protein
MFIIRHDPLREAMQQMRHQLFHQHFEQQPYEETQGTGGGWSPLVDVFEDNNGIMLKVELPEVDANDVDIQLEGNALNLRGERKLENADKQERYHRVERSYGTFSRSFTLPSTVETGNVTAQSRDGVLRIFLPKKAETKSRQIKVETDSSLGGQGMGRALPVA